MKLSQLEYFSAICKNNCNISKAANSLNVSQPAISNAIKDLESEFNVQLFIRNNKRLELTREGEVFLLSVNTILNNTAKLSEEMYNITHRKEVIRLGISAMTGTKYITQIMKEYCKQYPNVSFDLSNEGSPALIELIEKDELDFAICNIHKNINYQMRSLSTIPLYQTKQLFCTNKENPLAKEPFVTLRMIEKEPLAIKQNRGVNDLTIKKMFLAEGLNPNIPFYLEQIDAIKNFIHEGIASSFLFEDMIANEKDIVGIPLSINNNEATVGIVFKRNHYFSQHENAFIQIAKEICNIF